MTTRSKIWFPFALLLLSQCSSDPKQSQDDDDGAVQTDIPNVTASDASDTSLDGGRPTLVTMDATPLVPVTTQDAGSDGGDAALPVMVQRRGTVGRAGGTVTDEGIWLVIPAGALARDVEIALEVIDRPPAGTAGSAWEISPTGTTFAVPARLFIRANATALAGRPLTDFAVSTHLDGRWQPLAALDLDLATMVASGNVAHLSPYAIAAKVEAPVVGGVSCPDSACANGVCVPGASDYTCRCNTDYTADATGKGCTRVDNCPATGVCASGSCVDGIGDWSCTCSPGYLAGSDGKACADADECALGTVTCPSGAHCVNDPGAYHCSCDAGLVAAADGSCAAADPCLGVSCIGASHCEAGACACNSGYVKDAGGVCVAIDPCMSVMCSTGKHCAAGTCSCDSGLVEGPSGTCVVPDPCGSVSCGNGMHCAAGLCECNSGLVPKDATSCVAPDPCANVSCMANAHCAAGACACDAGTVMNQSGACVTPDPCASVTCPGGKHCTMGTCVCDSGLINGPNNTCVLPDPCAGVMCAGGRHCEGGSCSCNANLVPAPNGTCVPPDPCANVTCASGKHCTGGSCSCNDGLVPAANDTCALPDPCQGITCGGFGICSGGLCTCTDPAYTQTADKKGCQPKCGDAQCGANGSCTATTGLCTCNAGFMPSADSKACVAAVDHCIGVSCGHGGRCVNNNTGYTCECTGGTLTALHLVQKGPQACGCQTKYDDCKPDVEGDPSTLGCESPVTDQTSCGMCQTCFAGATYQTISVASDISWTQYSNPSCPGEKKTGFGCVGPGSDGWFTSRCEEKDGAMQCVETCAGVQCTDGKSCRAGKCVWKCPPSIASESATYCSPDFSTGCAPNGGPGCQYK